MKAFILAGLLALAISPASADSGSAPQTPPNPADAPLLRACAEGNVNEVVVLLGEGASITATDNKGFTPLMVAVATKHPEVVQKLIDLKAPLETTNSYGETALCIAGWKGNAACVKELCDAGARVDVISKNGSTPLMGAASRGDLDAMNVLLDHHANPDLVTPNGTPLTAATNGDRLEAMRLLLDRGADPNAMPIAQTEDHDVMTPLVDAASNGKAEEVDLLLAHGAKPDEARDGFTPLMMAAEFGFVPIMQTFQQHGARIDAQDQHGGTPLFYAAEYGHLDAVRQLLDWKANPNLVDDTGATPLIGALKHGWTEVASYLVDQGADVNVKDKQGETALGYAQARAFVEVVAELKSHGATPVDPRIIPYPPPRYPLTPAQAWAIAVGAIYLQVDGKSPLELLSRGENTRSSREMLKSLWNIHNKDELLVELHWLATEGHRTRFAQLGEKLAAMDETAFSSYQAANNVNEAKITACRDSYQKWNNRTGLAFDLCRYVNLVNNGYAAGTLTQAEAWNLIMPMAKKTQESFASWNQMAQNFLDGREVWSGQRDPRYDAIVSLLLNADDSNSPWQIPWNTDLGVTADTDTSLDQ